jgi:hypothetical protein
MVTPVISCLVTIKYAPHTRHKQFNSMTVGYLHQLEQLHAIQSFHTLCDNQP